VTNAKWPATQVYSLRPPGRSRIDCLPGHHCVYYRRHYRALAPRRCVGGCAVDGVLTKELNDATPVARASAPRGKGVSSITDRSRNSALTASGESGSNLNVGGTLGNTGAVQIGNGNVSAAAVVTLGGLANPSGASFAPFGSASHAATLEFSSGVAGSPATEVPSAERQCVADPHQRWSA
jgi:hypothetical protein